VKPTRNPDSAPVDWYIDTACIDCGASRHVAPNLIVERHGKERFRAAADDIRGATRCVARGTRLPDGVSPQRNQAAAAASDDLSQEITDGVWRCGFNARSSFGAHSYFVARPTGNILVDSPRYATELVNWFDNTGGIAHILLSHRDDVADADKYAARFGARVWIHHDDRSAAPYATDLLEGESHTRSRRASSQSQCQGTRAAASSTCSTSVSSSRATRLPGACATKTSSRFAMRAGIHGAR
jgi:hypothetical protein